MWLGTFLVLLSAVGYSLLPILIKVAYEETGISATNLVLWRFIIAVSIMWSLVAYRGELGYAHNLKRQQVIKIMGIGTLFGFAALSAFLSLDKVPATTYTVLLYTYPASVAIISLFFGVRLSPLQWTAITLTLFGSMLTAGGKIEGASFTGMFLVLCNATIYAFYLVLAARIDARVPAFVFGSLSMSGTLIVLIPVAVVSGFAIPDKVVGWLAILALVLFSTIMPILTMLEGLRRVGAPTAAIVSTLEPVLTVLLAALLLSERVSPIQYAGGALILASVLLLQIPTERIRVWRKKYAG